MQDIGKVNLKYTKNQIMNIQNIPTIILYFTKPLLSNIMQVETEEKHIYLIPVDYIMSKGL